VNLAKDLAEIFKGRELHWSIDGKMVIPTAKDIQETLDKAKEALYTEPVPSQMEVGRLIVRHWKQNQFDVYLQIGNL